MQRTPVASSNISSIGYDPASATLEVAFHDGGVYQYFGVPESVFRSLMAAGSKGGYLHDHIRDRYRYRRVR